MCESPEIYFEKRIVWGICSVGVPASIQNLLNVTGMTLLNNFTSSFWGRCSGSHGNYTENQYGSYEYCYGTFRALCRLSVTIIPVEITSV